MNGVAIVSGGMDSVTLAHLLRDDHKLEALHLVAFDYGQRHHKELLFARECAEAVNAQFTCIDLIQIGSMLAASGSSLVDMSTEVPHGHYEEESMKSTVVPNRNAIMLSIATGIAVAEGASYVATGVHAGDHAIYPDCRPGFILAMNEAMKIGNEGFSAADFLISAPFVHLAKSEIVSIGDQLGVDYSKTWSCYEGGDVHCGECGTCVERREAFSLAGVVDPTIYAERVGSA
jgi:7-cyano-7-deazaguanine synthase